MCGNPQGEAFVCFEALEEVLDEMAPGVIGTVEGLRLFIKSLKTLARDRAAGGPMAEKLLAEGQAVETLDIQQGTTRTKAGGSTHRL